MMMTPEKREEIRDWFRRSVRGTYRVEDYAKSHTQDEVCEAYFGEDALADLEKGKEVKHGIIQLFCDAYHETCKKMFEAIVFGSEIKEDESK